MQGRVSALQGSVLVIGSAPSANGIGEPGEVQDEDCAPFVDSGP